MKKKKRAKISTTKKTKKPKRLRLVIEGIAQFRTEDGGAAKIATICDDDAEDGVFVRIQSWYGNHEHPEAARLEGKRVKVIITEEPS